jgi:hypothetical protein
MEAVAAKEEAALALKEKKQVEADIVRQKQVYDEEFENLKVSVRVRLSADMVILL